MGALGGGSVLPRVGHPVAMVECPGTVVFDSLFRIPPGAILIGSELPPMGTGVQVGGQWCQSLVLRRLR